MYKKVIFFYYNRVISGCFNPKNSMLFSIPRKYPLRSNVQKIRITVVNTDILTAGDRK